MLPTKVKEAMQMQVEAERKKRANILESEGKQSLDSSFYILYSLSQTSLVIHLIFYSFLLLLLPSSSPPPPLLLLPSSSFPPPLSSSLHLPSLPHTPLVLDPGVRESAINRAQGLRQSKILASEALQIEQINKAKGERDRSLSQSYCLFQ